MGDQPPGGRMKCLAAAVSCIALAICGCAHESQPSDYDVVLKRPQPATDDARREECSWIQTQLARQKSLASYVAATATYPTLALEHEAAAQRNMAVLRSRAEKINCPAALPRPSFDACYSRCKAYTESTSEQCFDACNQ